MKGKRFLSVFLALFLSISIFATSTAFAEEQLPQVPVESVEESSEEIKEEPSEEVTDEPTEEVTEEPSEEIKEEPSEVIVENPLEDSEDKAELEQIFTAPVSLGAPAGPTITATDSMVKVSDLAGLFTSTLRNATYGVSKVGGTTSDVITIGKDGSGPIGDLVFEDEIQVWRTNNYNLLLAPKWDKADTIKPVASLICKWNDHSIDVKLEESKSGYKGSLSYSDLTNLFGVALNYYIAPMDNPTDFTEVNLLNPAEFSESGQFIVKRSTEINLIFIKFNINYYYHLDVNCYYTGSFSVTGHEDGKVYLDGEDVTGKSDVKMYDDESFNLSAEPIEGFVYGVDGAKEGYNEPPTSKPVVKVVYTDKRHADYTVTKYVNDELSSEGGKVEVKSLDDKTTFAGQVPCGQGFKVVTTPDSANGYILKSVSITKNGDEVGHDYQVDEVQDEEQYKIKVYFMKAELNIEDVDVNIFDIANEKFNDIKAAIIAEAEITPEDFADDASIDVKYYAGIGIIHPEKWADLNFEPGTLDPTELLAYHKFGYSEPSGKLEEGNEETVRVTVKNSKYPEITLQKEITATVKDTRIVTKFNKIAPITITYSSDNEAKDILAGILKQYPETGLVLEQETGDPIVYTKDDLSVKLDEAINAGETKDVTIRYNGTDSGYKPCETTVPVTVKKARAQIDVQQQNVVYDGKTHDPIVSVSPEVVDHVTVIVGIDGDAKGFVSIDFPKSLQERLDITNSKWIPESLREPIKAILDRLGIPYNIYEYIKTQIGDGKEISVIKTIINDVVNILNTEVPLSGGKTLAELLGLDAELLNQIAKVLDNIPAIGDVIVTLGKGPKNAGLYDVTAFTVDSNYTFDIDTDIFVIGPQTEGLKLSFDETMPKRSLIGTYEFNNPDQAASFDYSVSLLKDDDKEGIDQKHVKVLYYGIESDIEVELGTTPPTEPGLYRQTALVIGGNYFAAPISRTYLIDRYNVKIELVDEKVMYDGEPHALDVKVYVETEEGYEPADPEMEEEIKDSIDYVYTKGLEVRTNPPVDAGDYTVTAYLALSPKFNPAIDLGTLTISKVPVTLTLDGDSPVVYDGQRHGFTATAIADDDTDLSDDVLVVYSDTSYHLSTSRPLDAGTYKVTAIYPGSKNYESASATSTLVINKADVTIEMDDDTVVYDGKRHGLEYEITAESGEDLTDKVVVTYAGKNYYSTRKPVNAGTYKVTATYPGSKNHEKATAEATLVINKADVTITLKDKEVTYGDIEGRYADPEGLEYVVEGVAKGDVLRVTPTVAKRRTSYPEVGEYTITALYHFYYFKDSNYNVTVEDATLTIVPLDVDVIIENKMKYYTEEDPELTYILEELPYKWDKLGIVLERDPGEEVGTYLIHGSVDPENKNFNVHFMNEELTEEDGIFNIVEMPITITIDAKEKFVGDKDPELTATVTDINGKKVDPKEIGLKLTRKAGEEAGEYEITAEFTNESYTLAKLNKANLTIKKKAPVTGDHNNMGLWLALTILCALIAGFNVFMVLFKRKRSK